MVEGKVAFVQNRVHGTSSKYKLATTNHHGQGFCIGKLRTVSFLLAYACVFKLEGNAYATRKASSR